MKKIGLRENDNSDILEGGWRQRQKESRGLPIPSSHPERAEQALLESGNLHLEASAFSSAGSWPRKSLYVDSVLTFEWQNFEGIFANNVLACSMCTPVAKSKWFLLDPTAVTMKNCLKNLFSHMIPSQTVFTHNLCEQCRKKTVLFWKRDSEMRG